MAKIYDLPDGFEVPKFDFKAGFQVYREAENKFLEDLKTWCVERAAKAGVNDPNIGEIIDFPVADGKAIYMVAALSPVQLIHVPVGDAWDFQYAHKLNKKDIVTKIQQGKKLAELFGGKKK